ncbi:Transcriptional regulator PadR-like family protein [compost metagenome]|jgi:PadR family transcriptional regulator PadR
MPDTIDIQLKKGVLGLCVLALLARRDSYAYEIASRLSDAIGMGEGTIYPLMRRMQTDGLVETYMVESSSGPSRKYYRLTAAGRRALDGQTNEWRAFARAVEALIGGEGDDVVVAGAPAETPALADQSAQAEPTAQADRGEDQ